MTEEALTDAERQRVVTLFTREWVRLRTNPEFRDEAAECERIVRKLSGTDTRVICRRASSSGADLVV